MMPKSYIMLFSQHPSDTSFTRRDLNSDSKEENKGSGLFCKFRLYRPYLRSLLKKIEDDNRLRELRDEVDDIKYFLGVMTDMTADETHGTEGLRTFIDRIYELVRRFPIDVNAYVQSGDDDRNSAASKSARGASTSEAMMEPPAKEYVWGSGEPNIEEGKLCYERINKSTWPPRSVGDDDFKPTAEEWTMENGPTSNPVFNTAATMGCGRGRGVPHGDRDMSYWNKILDQDYSGQAYGLGGKPGRGYGRGWEMEGNSGLGYGRGWEMGGNSGLGYGRGWEMEGKSRNSYKYNSDHGRGDSMDFSSYQFDDPDSQLPFYADPPPPDYCSEYGTRRPPSTNVPVQNLQSAANGPFGQTELTMAEIIEISKQKAKECFSRKIVPKKDFKNESSGSSSRQRKRLPSKPPRIRKFAPNKLLSDSDPLQNIQVEKNSQINSKGAGSSINQPKMSKLQELRKQVEKDGALLALGRSLNKKILFEEAITEPGEPETPSSRAPKQGSSKGTQRRDSSNTADKKKPGKKTVQQEKSKVRQSNAKAIDKSDKAKKSKKSNRGSKLRDSPVLPENPTNSSMTPKNSKKSDFNIRKYRKYQGKIRRLEDSLSASTTDPPTSYDLETSSSSTSTGARSLRERNVSTPPLKRKKKGPLTRSQAAAKSALKCLQKDQAQHLSTAGENKIAKTIPQNSETQTSMTTSMIGRNCLVANLGLEKIKIECDYVPLPKEEPQDFDDDGECITAGTGFEHLECGISESELVSSETSDIRMPIGTDEDPQDQDERSNQILFSPLIDHDLNLDEQDVDEELSLDIKNEPETDIHDESINIDDANGSGGMMESYEEENNQVPCTVEVEAEGVVCTNATNTDTDLELNPDFPVISSVFSLGPE